MSFLTLDGVTKRYGDTTALSDVSLAVEEGEFFTLVGPSGCGKTTTLRLVAGFESPTSGTVAIDGRDVRGVPPEARGVGVVFQNYALFPNMTVGENVGYGLNFADPPGGVSRQERVEELLELVDLSGFEERDPTELSGGQKQRVALARALAPGPRLLLLDEPMSALDAQLRERLRGQVRDIQRELGLTTLYVTHDQEEALAVSDRVAVVNGGRIEQVDEPRAVYRTPSTPFVASFVGDNNVFRGRVVERADGTLVVDVDGQRFRVGSDGGDGSEVTTETATTLTVGTRVTFCVRPERLHVLDGTERSEPTPRGEGVPPENRLTATVERAEFLGETTRVRLAWNGRSLTVRAVDPIDGRVRLGFAPEEAHVVGVDARDDAESDGDGS